MDLLLLTPAQGKLLLHHRLYPGDAAFNIPTAYRITGDLDVPRLRGVIQRILQASASFNTTFHAADDEFAAVPPGDHGYGGQWSDCRGEVAVRRDGALATVPLLDAPPADSAEAESEAVAKAVGALADLPIPPEQWPLFRCELWTGQFATYLIIITSHLVSDEYTMNNFGTMVSRLYADQSSWPADAATLRDDPASLVAPGPNEPAAALFRSWFDGLDRLTHQALDEPRRPDGARPGRNEQRWLGEDVCRALRASDLARTSPYPVFLAAYARVLSAITGRRDVVIGVPLAGRRGRRQRSAFGYFVNTLPMPLRLDQYSSFGQLCSDIAARLPTMLRYQDFDLASHASTVFRENAPSPVAVDNAATFYHERYPLRFAGCVAEPLPLSRDLIRYPLGLHIQAVDERYLIGMEYLERLAPADPIACFEQVLRAGLAEPDRRPLDLPVVDPDRDEQIDRLVNDGGELTVSPPLDAWFTEVVRRHQHRVAVTDDRGEWTYTELDQAVSRVAAALRSAGGGRYVAVAMRPRRELVAVLLGVLRAGRAYVPLDPRAPRERVRHIVDQVGELTLVADPDLVPHAPVARRLDAGVVLAGQPAEDAADGTVCADRRDDPAYVIFTSGSTGVPKGVEVTHGNVARLIASADRHYDFGPDDVWCLFHSYAFDVSVWELFGSLLHGGRLAVPGERVIRSPEDFLRFLVDQRVTVLNQTPSAFRRLVGVLTPEVAERIAVRWVVFAGEALRFDLLRPWLDLVGERARLVNMYGITETTVHTTFYEIDPREVGVERSSVIGRPLADLSLAVVDDRLQRCPLGVPGELLVAGAGVARGYLGQPELTAARFLRGTRYGSVAYRSGDLVYVRSDGQLVYLDRADRQIQLRGYRIELGEVESALLAVPGIMGAHVGVHQPDGAEPYLVAWVVVGDELSDGRIRDELSHGLPQYMIPTGLVRVPDIPLTVNGKVDQAALPHPCSGPSSQTGPADDDVLSTVRRIWAETIQCAEVGPNDNFFEVGGTSMHITQVHRRLVSETEASDLSMIELFEYPTPAQLAARIGRRPGAAGRFQPDQARPDQAQPDQAQPDQIHRRNSSGQASARQRITGTSGSRRTTVQTTGANHHAQ